MWPKTRWTQQLHCWFQTMLLWLQFRFTCILEPRYNFWKYSSKMTLHLVSCYFINEELTQAKVQHVISNWKRSNCIAGSKLCSCEGNFALPASWSLDIIFENLTWKMTFGFHVKRAFWRRLTKTHFTNFTCTFSARQIGLPCQALSDFEIGKN